MLEKVSRIHKTYLLFCWRHFSKTEVVQNTGLNILALYFTLRIIVDFIRTDCVYGECSKSALCTLFNILVRSTYDRAVPQFAYSFVHSRSNLMQMNSKHPIYMKN